MSDKSQLLMGRLNGNARTQDHNTGSAVIFYCFHDPSSIDDRYSYLSATL